MKMNTVGMVLIPAFVAFAFGAASQPAIADTGNNTVQLAQQSEKKAPAAKKKKKRDPGKKLYMLNTCIACHGRNGKGAIMNFPNLAGQDLKYMIAQTKLIIAGKRTGSPDATGNPRSESMRGALITPEGKPRISNDHIKQIATWLSKMEPAKPQAPEQAVDLKQIKQGAKLYKKKCRSCHGKGGLKPLKGSPIIAGQKRGYLIIQTKDIRDKKRTSGKSKTMAAVVKKMTDEQIETIADYLSQIDRTAK